MKNQPLIGFIVILLSLVKVAHAQTSLVGPGSSYSTPFSPASTITYGVPGGGLVSVTLADGIATSTSGIWDLTAQGGANATILFSLNESAAQTALTGTALQFNISNDNNSLLGLLGVGTSIHYAWEAVAYFDTPGSVLNYTADTTYSITFDVDGNDGLLSSVAGLNPSFTFELIDGLGNALASNSDGTQVNIIGLLGTGVPTGTLAIDYTLGSSLPSDPIGIRFRGDAQVGATALSLGTTYASISNLTMTATPVPEPGGSVLIASVGLAMLLRRRRLQAPSFA
ncbi:MAG: PEP-CTERM sorting domain-containing protein [Verrucomicrobiaceae bacterium]|nr:PEP-CTERM sorting domain-containing protein [Verrucomicrobiaceae bacterium]